MSRRILVADDSSTIQKVIKIAFSRFDTEMVETSSYLEALSEVGQRAPDVLIIDASLPGAHGPEDFRKLREEAGGVPLLLLVGTYEKVDEGAFRAAGLDSFLKKPFESNDIVNQVDRLLGGALLQGGGASPTKTVIAAPPPPPPPFPGAAMETVEHDQATAATFVPPPPPPPPVHAATMEEDQGFASPVPPPLPITDSGRKGRKAFDDAPVPPPPPIRFVDEDEEEGPSAPSPLPPIPPGIGGGMARGADGHAEEPARSGVVPSESELARLLDERLPALVKRAVEDYCDRHFKSLAREVIASELRRLADEKARHLVDN